MREYQVRICERLGVKVPGPTRQEHTGQICSVFYATQMAHGSRGQVTNIGDQHTADRVMIMTGNIVGLTLMRTDDIPTFARWNQDLEFTALLGTPGEAHTLEVREEAHKQNSRVKPDSAEFAVLELSTRRLVGFGGLFDITRALVGTMFVGIGEAALRGRGYGTEASRLICEYGFSFGICTASR